MQNRNVKLAMELIDTASDLLMAEFHERLANDEMYAADTMCNLIQKARGFAQELEQYRANMHKAEPTAVDVDLSDEISWGDVMMDEATVVTSQRS